MERYAGLNPKSILSATKADLVARVKKLKLTPKATGRKGQVTVRDLKEALRATKKGGKFKAPVKPPVSQGTMENEAVTSILKANGNESLMNRIVYDNRDDLKTLQGVHDRLIGRGKRGYARTLRKLAKQRGVILQGLPPKGQKTPMRSEQDAPPKAKNQEEWEQAKAQAKKARGVLDEPWYKEMFGEK